jgi:hypothetical protein
VEDRDYYELAAMICALAVIGMLHAKLIARNERQIADVRTDVEFLKDHTVARETEARP